MVNMPGQCDPPRMGATLAQGLPGQFPRPYCLPNGRFIFAVVFPFGMVDPCRGGMVRTMHRPGPGRGFAMVGCTLCGGHCWHGQIVAPGQRVGDRVYPRMTDWG